MKSRVFQHIVCDSSERVLQRGATVGQVDKSRNLSTTPPKLSWFRAPVLVGCSFSSVCVPSRHRRETATHKLEGKLQSAERVMEDRTVVTMKLTDRPRNPGW